jgi:hypothetical protein
MLLEGLQSGGESVVPDPPEILERKFIQVSLSVEPG